MEKGKGGRARQAPELVQRTGERNWYIRFYDEEANQTQRVSTGKADRQAAELFLTNWIRNRATELKDVDQLAGFEREAPVEKRDPRVLPARLPPGVTKARKNQDMGRDAQGHRIEHQPPTQLKNLPDAESFNKAFKTRLKEARIAAGLSSQDVANHFFGPDTPTHTYRKRYENWEQTNPDRGNVMMPREYEQAFAKLTKVDLEFLHSVEVLTT